MNNPFSRKSKADETIEAVIELIKVTRRYLPQRGLAALLAAAGISAIVISQLKKHKEDMKVSKWLIENHFKSNHLYLDCANIAKDVYDQGETRLTGGWRRSSEFADIMLKSVTKEQNGLVSHLYSRINKKGEKEYIYAIAGTDLTCMQDIKNNFEQLYTKAEQYTASLEIAQKLKQRIGDSATLLFTGHSLGGGIATNNALQTGLHAIVFNPSGLSRTTLNEVHDIVDLRNPKIECLIACNQ